MPLRRIVKKYPLGELDISELKLRMLNWSDQFSILLFLDSNNYGDRYGDYEFLLAVGAQTATTAGLYDIARIHNGDWLFGHICYDYKNELEPKLESRHSAKFNFPPLYFFTPQTVLYQKNDGGELYIESAAVEPDDVWKAINNSQPYTLGALPNLSFQQRIDKDDYVASIRSLKQHIKEGDCYEINFCGEGYVQDVSLNPLDAYLQLNNVSPAPFSAYYRHCDDYMVCASPERYVKKRGDKITAQPIKGTAARYSDPQRDEEAKLELSESIKERAENVMITDLMRNDLARCCEVGSITVEELFGIYTFPQVHQMISTISGILSNDKNFADVLKYSFPMGSMTGAPKIKVMQLIDEYEQSKRELFSGTVGYITPEGNFDFNVIIRSLFYNAADKYLSYHTGGAITYDSVPEAEWDERCLKAAAIEKIFGKA